MAGYMALQTTEIQLRLQNTIFQQCALHIGCVYTRAHKSDVLTFQSHQTGTTDNWEYKLEIAIK